MSDVRLSVVAPCFNEAGNLPELVDRLRAVLAKRELEGEIVLVDDGSTDRTPEVVRALAGADPRVVGLSHDRNRGIEAAWGTGLSAARGDYVCLIDADLQNLPEDVWRLYREITLSNADLVQGCRSSIGRLKDGRYALSRGLNWLLNTLFGLRQRDGKSGFVVARREVLADILRHRYRYRYYQTFITVAARAKGYTVRELETLFESRLVGRSYMARVPVMVILACLVDIAKALVEFRLASPTDTFLADYLRETGAPARAPHPTGGRRVWFELYVALWPLHKWVITRRARERYEELLETQWLSPAQVRELQERKLRRLVAHACHHVPYYRQKLAERGLTPADVVTLADLRRLPLLDKAEVRDHLYFDLFADNHDKRRMLKVATSGSTGEPFVWYADRHQLEMRWASTLRSLEWTGYRFGDRQARLWHQTLGMSRGRAWKERLDAWLSRRMFVPAFEMSDDNIAAFVARLRRHRPVLVDGYAESFNFLADHVRRHAIEGFQPRAIVSSAQVLPETSRAVIEESFGCRVFDKYGSREFSGIAYECEAHDGHHVVAESYVVEILRDGRPAAPGELGEVVVTDLNNLSVPLIRYRVGDLAVAMDEGLRCACGRGLPRIGRIEGRVQAMILGTRGNYVPGTFFAHLLKDYDHLIRQYQVVQERPGAVTFRVIKGRRFDDAALAEVLTEMRRVLGEEMRIEPEFVERIALGPGGKHQGTLSRLDLDFQRMGRPGLTVPARTRDHT